MPGSAENWIDRRVSVANAAVSSSRVLVLGRSGTGTAGSAAYAVQTKDVLPASARHTETTRSGGCSPSSGSRSSRATSRRSGTVAPATSAGVATATIVRQATATTWPSRNTWSPSRRSGASSSPYLAVHVIVTAGKGARSVTVIRARGLPVTSIDVGSWRRTTSSSTVSPTCRTSGELATRPPSLRDWRPRVTSKGWSTTTTSGRSVPATSRRA